MRKEIKKIIKKNKLFWVGCLIGIIVLVMIPIIIEINKPKPMIATDDIFYGDTYPYRDFSLNGSAPMLIAGRYENEYGSSIHSSFI